MELWGKLFQGKGYIDGITIINLEGEVLFTAKLNRKLSGREDSYRWVGKKFLDIYENLNPQNSTIIKAMELGMPIYIENQDIKVKGEDQIRISALSIPIKSGGRIVGAIDLSVEETQEPSSKRIEKINLNCEDFPITGSGKFLAQNRANFTMEDIIARDERMKLAKEYIPVVASCDLPVMIYGETGTGKEVFAQAIHNASARADKAFIAQNCAAIPDTLLESVLFGTSKGAFTGATDNKGLLELADGGTLFLDELNSMPLYLQSKLLRVVQDGCFRSLGDEESKSVDVKIITSMNIDPLRAIEEGRIRRDIYHRLSMMSIEIPPLRKRKKDIEHFVKYYINKHNKTFQKNIQYISKELLDRLKAYDWPGNVRELEHIIVYGMSVVHKDSSVLEWKDVEEKFSDNCEFEPMSMTGEAQISSLKEMVEKYEKHLICRALRKQEWNVSATARLLDVPRQTLQRKMYKYDISADER
ncbi:MAG: sigma 54-interacting transcriptional regulator [Filifactor alocis]|nr:sigma 54-interacting transcriptional regulator [Filifactor alocis]